jgi:glycosyltransferase involved in cell wall biosynthesis
MQELVGNIKVSVVVPVYNPSHGITSTIDCLLRQSVAPHEIIIVDDGSTDGTPEVLKNVGPRVTVLRKENGGPASARNRGVRAASGDFVAFTDSDALPDEHWLENLLKGFVSPRVAGTGGVVRGVNSGIMSEYADFKQLYDPGRDEKGGVRYFATCNACFRRAVILEAGLFDERFPKPGGEDEELCQRVRSLGYELKAVEDAVVFHHHKSFKKLLVAQSNYGEGAYITSTIWPERRWRGSPVKGLVAGGLSMFSVFNKSSAYRPRYGWIKSLAFSFFDQSILLASTWGYLRGRRKRL